MESGGAGARIDRASRDQPRWHHNNMENGFALNTGRVMRAGQKTAAWGGRILAEQWRERRRCLQDSQGTADVEERDVFIEGPQGEGCLLFGSTDLEWLNRFKRDSYAKKVPGSRQSLGPEDLCVRGCVRSPAQPVEGTSLWWVLKGGFYAKVLKRKPEEVRHSKIRRSKQWRHVRALSTTADEHLRKIWPESRFQNWGEAEPPRALLWAELPWQGRGLQSHGVPLVTGSLLSSERINESENNSPWSVCAAVFNTLSLTILCRCPLRGGTEPAPPCQCLTAALGGRWRREARVVRAKGSPALGTGPVSACISPAVRISGSLLDFSETRFPMYRAGG